MSEVYDAATEVGACINALDDKGRALNRLFDLPTKRELAAMFAMQGIIARLSTSGNEATIATAAVTMADALLNALDKNNQ